MPKDDGLSQRLKLWRLDTNTDYLTLVQEQGKALAIIAYKRNAVLELEYQAKIDALLDLADKAGLPVILCRHNEDFSWFEALPLNKEARKIRPCKTEYTESGWVYELYRIRGQKVPEEVLQVISKGEWP